MLWSLTLTTLTPSLHAITRTFFHVCFLLFSTHRVLRSYKFKLEKDLRDKLGAQDIDTTCAGLTDDRRDLTYSPEAVKIQAK